METLQTAKLTPKARRRFKHYDCLLDMATPRNMIHTKAGH